jgi:hypothetical protein
MESFLTAFAAQDFEELDWIIEGDCDGVAAIFHIRSFPFRTISLNASVLYLNEIFAIEPAASSLD